MKDKIPGGHEGPNGTYNQSGGTGNGSWFYRSAGTPGTPAVAGTPAVPGTPAKAETFRTEYHFEVYAFHYEYRFSIYERGITKGTDAIECETDEEPVDEEPTDETPTDPNTENPTVPDAGPSGTEPFDTEPSEPGRPAVSNAGLKPNRPSARSRAVPLSIDAGL